MRAYLTANMTPVAYYPAARPHADRLHDLVILAHCAEPVERCPVFPCPEVAAFLPTKETI